MKPTILLFVLAFSVGVCQATAQTLTQTIRGTVIDQVTKSPMPGATVMILDTEPLMGAVSDQNGEFKIPHVPLGSHTLRVGFIGYRDAILPQILVNSGKETVLTVAPLRWKRPGNLPRQSTTPDAW